jgi:hypothetical protein
LLLKSEINEDKPLVVGVSKAKVLLDCSRDRIYSFIKSGELESYVEGTRRKITMASIERLIAGRLAANGSEFQRERTAQMLMAIAANPVLSNTNHGSDLPPSWRTLYELTKLPEPVLLAKIKDHTINSEMERTDVQVIAASVAKPEVTKAEWPKSLPETDEVIEAETVEVTPPTGPQSSEAEDEGAVADPATIEDNVLYYLQRMNEHARVYKKLFKLSAFDRERQERLFTAIERTIQKLRSTQAILKPHR